MSHLFKLFIAAALLAGSAVYSQPTSLPANNIPVTLPLTAPDSVPYPELYNIAVADKVNFVRNVILDQPLQTLSGSYSHRQHTEYFDGLGRSLQSVDKRAHASGNDIVQHHVYDAVGRERYQYLPFAAPLSLLTTPGQMKPSVNTHMRGFYDQAGPDEQPYSRTDFDNSPLNRPLKQLNPGRSWVGSDRGANYSYESNVTNEVLLWSIGTQSNAVPTLSGTYAAGELSVTVVTDEDGNITKEFKDKNGNLVLKKNYVFYFPPDYAHTGYACTYYVYDDVNRLRYVLPPMAVYNMPGNWDINAVKDYCYSYYYDKRGRLAEKKIPGQALEEYVYDRRDRMVYNRDGNTKANNQWAFTLYDALDRPIVTGLGGYTSPRDVLQGLVDDPANQYPAPSIWAYINNFNLYHTYPATIEAGTILSYTYYDDYNELSSYGYDYAQFNDNLPTINQPHLLIPPAAASAMTKGLVTGTKVRVMNPQNPDAPGWITTVNYYDDHCRLIQSQSNNIRNGTDISSTLYYFQGMPWKTIKKHRNPSALAVPGAIDGAVTEHKVVTIYERGIGTTGGNEQVRKINRQINDGPIFNLVNYSYDHLGRVTLRDLRAGLVLQRYNMRGMLETIDAEDHSIVPFKPIFQELLYYDKGFASKLYNGNIAGIMWSGADDKPNAYGYSYDKLNRLTHAEYRFKDSTGQWLKNTKDYTVSNISYDYNGNILAMNQRIRDPLVATPPIDMDILSYSYATNSNRLLRVEDQGTPSPSFPDFENGASLTEEYTYDANGNMTSDANKKISAIQYNYLDKPQLITTDSGTIAYVYDATGDLLQKYVRKGTNAIVYDFIGDFVYQDSVLQYILNEEGRTRPVANDSTGRYTRYVYDYFIKDHLGNVRSTVTANPINAAYLARHEIATANLEQLVFDNIPNVRDAKPGSINPNDGMAAHLDANDPEKRIGTAIMLQVMPGDKFSISANTFYEGAYTNREETGNGPVIESLMNALMGGNTYAGVPISELPEHIQTIQQAFANPALSSRVADIQAVNNDPDAPKAHLNYLFFNSAMELQADLSGAIQVQPGGGGWQSTGIIDIRNGTIEGPSGPGFVIIYVDNQSIGKNVWFDNIHIEHYTSKVLSEDHYYPYGLAIKLDQNPAVPTAQPHKYQSIQLEQHFGLETYETYFRGLDPQIGRFRQVDPKADIMHDISPYASMNNNPVSYTDPMGDLPGDPKDDEPGWLAKSLANAYSMIGLVGKQMAPPSYSRKSSYQKSDASAALERMELFEAGIGAMFMLSMPIEMVQGEAMPINAELRAADNLAEEATAGVSIAKNASKLASEAKEVVSVSRIWEVGPYNKLQGVEKDLDAHHVGQKALMKIFEKTYDMRTAPTILVPSRGHTKSKEVVGIVSRNVKGITDARKLVARDIKELRRVYPQVPNKALQELINFNKSMYPNAMQKVKMIK